MHAPIETDKWGWLGGTSYFTVLGVGGELNISEFSLCHG